MSTFARTPASAQTSEQRTQNRVAVRIPAILRLPEVRGGIFLVTVLDLSKTGLRITCPRALPSGSRLELKFNDVTVFGVARYSRAVEEEFQAGIEADGVKQSTGEFQSSDLDLTLLFGTRTTGPISAR